MPLYGLNCESLWTSLVKGRFKRGLLKQNKQNFTLLGARSIFGLPVLNPLSTFARLWMTLIMILDLTYTAFVVPMTCGFQLSDLLSNWGGIINLCAGKL